MFIHPEDALQRIDIEPSGERGVLERLRDHVPRRAVPFQLDHDCIPLAIYPKQVDACPEVGSDLAPDDQNLSIFKNPVGVGLQPLLKDGFLMIHLERQLLVLGEFAVRSNAKDAPSC